jgi:DNA-binding NarL/FixJ family response regulator
VSLPLDDAGKERLAEVLRRRGGDLSAETIRALNARPRAPERALERIVRRLDRTEAPDVEPSLSGPGRPPRRTGPISAREVEVLQLVADGFTNIEISERLFLSEETIKSHIRHILGKLQARCRAHAVAIALRTGLIY